MKSFALTLLLFITCSHLSIAEPPDCDSALKTCNEGCENNNFPAFEATDFERQCHDSCQKGFEACKLQDSQNACATFNFHCVDNCPWTVNGQATGLQYSNAGSFATCSDVCDKALEACLVVNKKLPPRKRTGKFDPCEEAQGSCYANCAETVDRK